MRDFQTEEYIRLVENIDDDRFERYMEAEAEFLRETPGAGERTFVDLGAGYGRVLSIIAAIARNIVSIEINPGLTDELVKRGENFKAEVIVGDMLGLPKLIEGKNMVDPVFLILQNTLGTIEGGNYRDVLTVCGRVMRGEEGSAIVSVLREGVFADWGISFYQKISEMVGEPDLEKCDPEHGRLVTKTGYTSKWWSDTEIEEMKSLIGGDTVREIARPEFWIFEVRSQA